MGQEKSRKEAEVLLDTRNLETGMESKLLQQLEEWLAAYDHIFLVPEEDTYVSGILRAGAGKTRERKILLLSTDPITVGDGFTNRQIAEENQMQLLRLYHMYEFSDRFSVLSEENAYGGLFHLVTTGQLSMEEAAQALFGYR